MRNITVPSQISQLSYAASPASPQYSEEALYLLPPAAAYETISGKDWSFSDDDTSFLAHDIHPYPAKFIPQIPGTLIALLSGRGEVVLDPFGGSGTTALEAVRLGRRAISVDANPLSALIGKAKTSNLDRKTVIELNAIHAALASELQSLPVEPNSLVEKYGSYAPYIANREKWFSQEAFGELCLIKARIAKLDSQAAKDIALVALSRIAIRTSFQDSETRYKSVPREIPVGETLKRYLKEFAAVLQTIARSEAVTRYGISDFIRGDIRYLGKSALPDGSVDLVVTSPPYGNATDYHLYHRFRLLWLGYDPSELSSVEIGSHLKHQREKSGFDSYFDDLKLSVSTMGRALRPGRYAALVLGSSVYRGQVYDSAEKLSEEADQLGFDSFCIFDRQVHATRRSFAHVARRATTERILVMRKKSVISHFTLAPPPYKLWPYERILRLREAGLIKKSRTVQDSEGALKVPDSSTNLNTLKKMTFSHVITATGMTSEPTWQAIIENGNAINPTARKDPKYATHGIHPYKGKFYPQLAKALINVAGIKEGSTILDPFCGSGTTLLEGYLNGFVSYGCDMNPLAAKIARAKTEALEVDPNVFGAVVGTIQEMISSAPSRFVLDVSEFAEDCLDELKRWFPVPVIGKLSWLIKAVKKASAGSVQNFLEVVLSSVLREVSQQEPSDLRVRYRKNLINDADVLGLFGQQLAIQYQRLEKFWRIKGRAPAQFYSAHVIEGDNRLSSTYATLGLATGTVDLVLTSPPYATALPYIDTDRLSLLTLLGLSGSSRKPLDHGLTGSREISLSERRRIENLQDGGIGLPEYCRAFLADMGSRLAKDSTAGFRKLNMPALMTRYLIDMEAALRNAYMMCKPAGHAMIVIGDNRIQIGGQNLLIPTTDLVESVALGTGFQSSERIDISVTTENMMHQKNAITKNVVLHFRKPS